MGKRYDIHANGNRICPCCNAPMQLVNGDYKCFDCKKMFRIVGQGQADNDLEVEEIETTV
jgi:Zn finger protein HypA/HybF involved in hydrogenase expression